MSFFNLKKSLLQSPVNTNPINKLIIMMIKIKFQASFCLKKCWCDCVNHSHRKNEINSGILN